MMPVTMLTRRVAWRADRVREFDGKVAFVTGGASGLGFALARAFGRANMQVMLADIEVDALHTAVAELKGEGIDARGVECDVADRASVQHAASETLAAFGKVHVLCNNAGVSAGGPIERITPGDWDWVIGVELMGAVYGIQAFLPHLKSQGEGGHVVTVASMAGMVGLAGAGPHVAAKFGLVGLSEVLAAEMAGTSIGVSMLCCGFMRTRQADSARNRPERYGTRTEVSPAAAAQLAALVRSGQEPQEVAEMVMRAIKENELYIFTDPGFRSALEERSQRILAAYPKP
jgi:NAD(P)-dependent dehydrogenase (short-subunit alcohol dehydrogenase family)